MIQHNLMHQRTRIPDLQAEFDKEACHLLTLFEQGRTLEEALSTVREGEMREQLKPLVYDSTLRALLLVALRLRAITAAQFRDLESYLLIRSEARSRYAS